ncbi:MAG TPA: valine--tRNA ligase [Candidatus Baltobacteraceae bacterium]|nr:valine--tRNA ligase [Candidatus Baltobacteraceae bacterium]
MYDSSTEDKWNAYWRDNRLNQFDESDTKRKVYSIDTPPPFTSGTLHMGHVMSYTLIDFVARYKRMKGFNVLYPQGWDTQGFPTEKAVEKKFGKGLPREEFYKKCSEMATENLAAMKAQMFRLGFSSDDRFEYVTMSPEYRAKVQLSLLMMHEKGLVYRERYPVEWCSSCRSAIANAEAEDKSQDSTLAHLNFGIKGEREKHITIATTRAELLHGCVALAVNPKDERYSHLIGKMAVSPLFKKEITIIGDDNVEKEFGTGAEMVCTFGDKEDRAMYYRHKLNAVESLDEKGMLMNAGEFTGLKIADARIAVLDALEKSGALVKREGITHNVKVHDRCGTEIELIMSTQWFVKIKEYVSKIKALGDEMRWIPEFTHQYLDDWANFIDWDWIISRNRVFGTPLPFWYCEKCGHTHLPKREDLPVNPAAQKSPVEKCPKCGGGMVGETATADVWIDSSITPLVISGWPDNKALMERALPASLRLQGTEIIRTWAFYTIFRTWALTEKRAFDNILNHGMVLGTDGKRMHKSKGNGISPDDLFQKYPVDAIRLWAALSGAIGKDKPFIYNDIDYAKSFLTKLFNSAAFVRTATAEIKEPKVEPSKDLGIFDIWILNRLNTVTKQVEESYEKANFYDATNSVINFYWHEFCDYYLENVKHRVYSIEPGMTKSRHAAAFVLDHVLSTTLRLLFPIIPHAAEEVNAMFERGTLTAGSFPQHVERPRAPDYVINGLVYANELVDVDYEDAGAFVNGIISEVRKAKASGRIALNKEISSINIKVPEEYYKATMTAVEEVRQICKAKDVSVSKGAYSVGIQV